MHSSRSKFLTFQNVCPNNMACSHNGFTHTSGQFLSSLHYSIRANNATESCKCQVTFTLNLGNLNHQPHTGYWSPTFTYPDTDKALPRLASEIWWDQEQYLSNLLQTKGHCCCPFFEVNRICHWVLLPWKFCQVSDIKQLNHLVMTM